MSCCFPFLLSKKKVADVLEDLKDTTHAAGVFVESVDAVVKDVTNIASAAESIVDVAKDGVAAVVAMDMKAAANVAVEACAVVKDTVDVVNNVVESVTDATDAAKEVVNSVETLASEEQRKRVKEAVRAIVRESLELPAGAGAGAAGTVGAGAQ
jgi:methyl-accepting chemotaxis protein